MRDRVPVFITLMSDDEDGRWRVALEDRGAEVGGFDRSTRAYSANVFYGDVGVIAAADFVLSIEQERLVEPLLASAVPVMGADGVRMYSGERGLFDGVAGASVAVGVLDTGLNIHHTDIATHRSSVCGANLGSFAQDVGDADLWYDFTSSWDARYGDPGRQRIHRGATCGGSSGSAAHPFREGVF